MDKLDKLLTFFGKYKDPLIGLDISSSAVKVIELCNSTTSSIKLNNYAIEPLDEGVVVEKQIKDKQAVVAAIKKAFHKSGITSRLVAMAIPNTSAVIRTIQINENVPNSEIEIDIVLEAEKVLPYPLEEVSLDYEMIGINKNSPDKLDILLVASKHENIDTLLEITDLSNLVPKIVEVDSFSTERAFKLVAKQLPEAEHGKIIALVDIGANSTVMNIFKDMTSIYTRSQSFGGQNLQQEIQTRYGLSAGEARIARKLGELPEDYLYEILDPFKERIAEQLSNACQYFYSASEYDHIDYILLTGGVSTISGLDINIEEKLHTKTIIANPFANMEISDHIEKNLLVADSATLMTCCGLALRNHKL